ncbi:hypothetical protein SAMN02910297_00644 [Methanobrevibacter olleyae]|uniref:Uncharacterized protein n=1 Tax=Methanobrevibacter olleyae TaxID=294671 RepID=A0A1I4H0K8_METOL|nr:hypothetical protein [Methanobrevibacter olleyae]SFL34946.1 hypothetical protein SAMN02910297_00644 [Methanobrevibacter olleyae]
MDLANEKFLKRVNLSNQQKQLNKMFEEEGLTDEILEKQIQLNRERHEFDINDPTETLYVDREGNLFVQ